MRKKIYLDNAAATELSGSTKEYLRSVLDLWGNPSSPHSAGEPVRQLIEKARCSVAAFLNTAPGNIFFVPSGSAANTLAVRGLTSDNPQENQYEVFYSPTAHKSMRMACESCICHTPLKVTPTGETDLNYLEQILTHHNRLKPLVCIEAANSEIGTINDIHRIGSTVHRHAGILAVDATAYLPSLRADLNLWQNDVDLLTFSGHKLHALKGTGVLWKRETVTLKPLIYGSQEGGIAGGTENVAGIASLGHALEGYDYSSVSPDSRDYLYNSLIRGIPDIYPVGPPVPSGNRLPQNLYLCFRGVEGESLTFLLDLNGIQVSTGSACSSRDLTSSPTLTAIGMNEEDLHSCIRFSLSGQETKEELDYVCRTLEQCVKHLRILNSKHQEETTWHTQTAL